MRSTFDFSPLYRSVVGFDRPAELLESAAKADAPATDGSQAADASQTDGSQSTDGKKDSTKESSSKKKGLKKLIPW